MRGVTGLFMAMLLMCGAHPALAMEKIEVNELPKGASDALKAKFPKAEITEAEMEMRDGRKIYEIKLLDGKTEVSVSIFGDGKITEIEKQLDPKNLPKAIAEAIEAKFPKSTVTEAREVTLNDQTTFEVSLTAANGKKFELSLDPAGKILEATEVKEPNQLGQELP
jgi:uncharacterized membrane protein YkoI